MIVFAAKKIPDYIGAIVAQPIVQGILQICITNQSSSPTKKTWLGLGDKAHLAPYFERSV